MSPPPAHIAGVGTYTRAHATLAELAVAAGTKALLDAGITYKDVDQGIACFNDQQLRIPRSCFTAFGRQGAPVSEVDSHSALFLGTQCIRSRQVNCIMIIGIDQEITSKNESPQVAAVAVILISSLFLTSHAYLKDSAVCVRGLSLADQIQYECSMGPSEAPTVNLALHSALRQAQLEAKDIHLLATSSTLRAVAPQVLEDLDAAKLHEVSPVLDGSTGLLGLCELVWQLRGWVRDQPVGDVQNCLQYMQGQDGSSRVVILGRSDGRAAPPWSDIEHLRDGRERLAHNPAVEMRGIAKEDYEAVRASHYTTDNAPNQVQLPIKGRDRAALARL